MEKSKKPPKKKSNEPKAIDDATLDELLTLILEFYDNFRAVLKKGTEKEKITAIQTFKMVQQQITARLADFQEVKGVDFKKFEEYFNAEKGELGEKMRRVKEDIRELTEAIEPEVKKVEDTMPKKKKSRRSKMEKHLRAKE